ncbi:MAG TPA: SPASM domain-containing protein [Nitrosomonas sp.]|nr:SPASM domain-containing protein [Nitrosomonas sp.]
MINADYLTYRSNYLSAIDLKHDHPIDISLELSSYCNQRCGYCYHADKTNLPFKLGLMNIDLAKSIIHQGAAIGVNSIKMNFRGESTVNPAFEEICQEAKRYANGITYIDRLTNSNFKFATDREDIFRGLACQTKVKISFDSFVPSVMEYQRAGSIHELALRNIEKFYNYHARIKSETTIVIQAVRTLLNKDEDIAGEAKRRWPEVQVSIRDMVAGRVDRDLSALESVQRDTSERQSCIQAHARLLVGWDGKVQVCCPDIGSKLIIGDANKESISEIWNSEKAKKIRQTLIDKTAFANEPCKSCSSYESYKGYRPPADS